jgi:hypothetical protein
MSEAAESQEVNSDLSSTEANDGNYNSFEDLESMTNDKSDTEVMKEAVAEVKESNDSVKEEIKADRVSEKTVQENSDDISESIEQEMVEEIKKLEAKFGEERLEIPQDAVFTVKIDGEEQEISLNDLRNNYSGQVSWDKKFQELSTDKKQFMTERSQIEKYVNEFGDLARAGDKMGAMQYLASLSGMDPLQFRRELRDQIIGEYGKLNEMSDVERTAFELQEENEFLKYNKESEQSMAEQYRQEQEMNSRIDEIQETLNLDEDQWDSLVNEVSQEYDGEITPEIVGQYAYAKEVYNTSENLLSQVNPELSQNDALIEEVADIMLQNPHFTNDDILDILHSEFGSPQKQVASKKASASAKRSQPQQKAASPASGSKIDHFYSFDQLED